MAVRFNLFLRRRLFSERILLPRRNDSSVDNVPPTGGDSDSSDGWKRAIILGLSQELKLEHRRYAVYRRRMADEHRIICFIRDGRCMQLLSYINKVSEALPINEMKKYGEIFSISLKYAADRLRRKLHHPKWLKSKDSLAFIDNFVDTMISIPLCSNDVVLVNGFCLVLLKRWKCLTFASNEDCAFITKNIYELERRLERFTKSWKVEQNRLLFNDKDFGIVCDYFKFKNNQLSADVVYLGYNHRLNLIKDLCTPAITADYRGSPFALSDTDDARLLNRLYDHLADEQQLCFSVKNYARNSVEKPMEKLLFEWRWDKAIASTFKHMTGKISSLKVRHFLSNLDTREVSNAMLQCVVSVLCQGKSLISLPEFRYVLSCSVLALSHRDFVKNSLIKTSDTLEQVCREYFRYFADPKIAQQYSLREWWHLSTRKCDIDPEFHVPFSNFRTSITNELSNFLIDVIINACRIPETKLYKRCRRDAFSFRNVHIDQLGENKNNKAELVKMIELNPVLVQLIAEHQFENLLFQFHTMPMTVPPRPWMDAGRCGPMYSKSSDVLRNVFEFPVVDVNVGMSKRLRESSQARPVFDSLNDLGATPWIINKSMLNELVKAFDCTFKPEKKELLKHLAIPMHPSTVRVPTIHDHFDCPNVSRISNKDWFEFSKKEHELIKERNESNSLWCWLMYRIVLANHFRDETLYFPHNMDFRGRVYPISPHLNHMGDDINRCLLKFARGKPLGRKGFDWLKIHCVNLTGLLKQASVDDRLAYAQQHMNDIIYSANHPWSENAWWRKSDEPWQTLAACMEIRDVMRACCKPKDFVSHLPVHQDGSCNGFQHYAALGRDEQGAAEVNLLPSATPADIYSNVAARVEEKRLADEKSDDEAIRELVLDLRKYIPQTMPRKVIKQTVMTTVYGVTMFGAREQVKRQLKALEIPSDKLVKFSTYIAEKTLGSLNESFESSMALKNWFQQCAKTVVKLMHPVEWETPLGLPVVQPYIKPEKKFDLLCHLPIAHKQVDAFPPNFVHSLDSTHMMLTNLHCRRRGVTFAAVHDCFWTHATDVPLMNKICREQFIRLHKEPIVENLGKQFRDLYLTKPDIAKLDRKLIREFKESFTPSDKRGTLDLNKIQDSVYFFS